MAKKPTSSAGSKSAKPAKKAASDGGFLGRAAADDGPVQRPEVKAALAREGTEVALSKSPEDFVAFLAEDNRFWARLVKDAGVKID